ncbi:MAG: DUF3754 domain-containing protein [Planctomycetes bacterium]|nr:DUF3754 domain-containing protein [Planctomycetota bacterium]
MAEHFIPFRKADLVAMCLGDPRMLTADAKAFSEFCVILAATFHFEFHRELETLKDLYAPLDPNRDTRELLGDAAPDLVERERELLTTLGRVLTRGNYRLLEPDELNRALNEESVFRVKLHVDLGDFAQIVLHARGSRTSKHALSRWFGLRKETKEVEYYERVVLYARFHDAEHFPAKRRKKLAFTPGSTLLKLFQNIPKADLEMLLPNTEVRMKLADQLIIGVPAIAGGLGLFLKLGASLLLLFSFLSFYLGLTDQRVELNKAHLVGFGLGLLLFGMHLFRQMGRFKNRKIAFMKALSDSLYFKNLDNNAGVFHKLIDDAEEEECKEALLAYFVLHSSGMAMDAATLDAAAESWVKARTGYDIDFEVEDGLAKLVRLGLVTRDGDAYRAVPLAQAKGELDRRWDGYFTYA